MTAQRWAVLLSAAAGADFHAILRWTKNRFGPDQASAYEKMLSDALAALARGPEIVGARERPDIRKDLYTFHVARHGRPGRHFIVFRVQSAEDRTIDVLRILHDAMELSRHLPPSRDE